MEGLPLGQPDALENASGYGGSAAKRSRPHKGKPVKGAYRSRHLSGLTSESIVDIRGVLVPADVKSCTQSNVELQIQEVTGGCVRPPVGRTDLSLSAPKSRFKAPTQLSNGRPSSTS